MNNIYGFDIEAVPLQLYSPEAILLCASISQEFTVSYVKDHYQREIINEEINLFCLACIGSILNNKSNIIVGHNLPFDIVGWERFYQVENPGKRAIKAKLFDTMIAHYLVGYKDPEFNNLNFVAKKYLSKRFPGIGKLDIKPKDIPTTPIDELLAYNAVDSLLTYKLYEPLMNEIVDNNFEILFKYLMKILGILINMSIRGVRLDLEYIRKHRDEVTEKIGEIHTKLVDSYSNINFNSPKQLVAVLYDNFNLPILEYTDKGNPSVGVDGIIKLKNHPDVTDEEKEDLQALLNYRKLNKLKSTYLQALEKKHLGYDGRVHAQYFLGKGYDQGFSFGTVSGRTSSSNPNLQNQPNIVTIDGLEVNVRKSFIPTEGFKFYKADYSQIEMRVAAFLSGDKTMLDVFRNNIDIHTYSLTGVYEEDYDYIIDKLEKEDPEWKRRRLLIKNFNFALIYGASPFKLQMMLLKQLEIDMPIDEVRMIVNKWNRLYPQFTKYRYAIYNLIYHLGYVKSETGRIRWFFNEGEGNHYDKKAMAAFCREGLNDLIQSFANDIAMFGIMYLYSYMRKNKIGYPLLPVHDSIDGEYNKLLLESEVRKCMIDRPKRLLEREFIINTDNLYLDVEVKTDLLHWS